MQCPNCGRPISFDEKYAKVVSCPYCNSILEFGGGELTKVGEQGYFIEFPSQFKVGESLDFKGKKIYVKGQLRFEYDGGFFDDFFVEIDGKTYYVREDDGNFVFFSQEKFTQTDISLINQVAGENFKFLGNKFFIEEIGIFKLVNMKGFVDTNLEVGVDYEYLIGINSGKKYFFEKNTNNKKIRICKELNTMEK